MTAPIGLYVRVSRKGDREDERFHSPREQAERARSLVLARGLEPGPVFEDIDVSGATSPAQRPAMGELLRQLKAGKLGGIAAFSLDRLSREPSHGDALVKAVTKAGGIVLTPDIPDAIDSPTGEFTFGMLLQVAKLYRSQAGARFETAKARSIAAGIPVGPTPIGYRQRDDRRIEVDPETAPLVRELFEAWARGEGRGALAARLDAATGRTWSREAIPRIIKNRLYATGRLQYGKYESEWDAGAIVDEALWQAAQRTTPARPARSDAGWLLTGLVRCAGCGLTLKASTNGAGGKYRNYKCRNRACTSRVSMSARWLEGVMTRLTFERDTVLASQAETTDLAVLEEALAVAERRLAHALEPEVQDAAGEAWPAMLRTRRAERDNAAAALGAARAEAGEPVREYRLADVWENLDARDRRESLRLFWKAVYVGRRVDGEVPVRLVARGPGMAVELELPAA